MSKLRQQINLYQPAADGSGIAFSFGTTIAVAAIVGVSLLALWGWGQWRVSRIERAVNTLREQQQHQAATMTALTAARAQGESPEQIQNRVNELSLVLATHSRALELLRAGSVGQTDGFSRRLSALARHPLSGLWIDRVVLSGIDGTMSVGGMTLDPELVPRYLRGLATETALAGIRFDQFAIERPSAVKSAEASAASARDARLDHGFRFKAESNSAPKPVQAGTS
jgi:hypothetical protein